MSHPEIRTDNSLEMAKTLWAADVSAVIARVLKWILTLGIVGVVAATALGVWRFSDFFYDDALLPPPGLVDPPYTDGTVVSIGDGQITLQVSDAAAPSILRNGEFGIQWEGGRGRLGEIVEESDGTVTRRFSSDDREPAPGDSVTVNGITFYGDPTTELGIDFTDVEIDTELGDVPAWYVEGEADTWVIFIHGKGAGRIEALRALPVFVANDLPALIIGYRNDPGTEFDPSGIYQFGLTEWRDLQSAVQWSLDRGAERVILVGYSMGGGVTMEFMHRSAFNDRVAGIVLDAPMLDLSRTVDLGASEEGIPPLLTSMSKTVAAMRFGLNWSELNYLAKANLIDVPTLIFHGTDDRRVPIELSVDLADALPEVADFVPIDGAGHVESWNVARLTYEAKLRDLMHRVETAATADEQ